MFGIYIAFVGLGRVVGVGSVCVFDIRWMLSGSGSNVSSHVGVYAHSRD